MVHAEPSQRLTSPSAWPTMYRSPIDRSRPTAKHEVGLVQVTPEKNPSSPNPWLATVDRRVPSQRFTHGLVTPNVVVPPAAKQNVLLTHDTSDNMFQSP